jgi:hypothetical protein
MILGMNVAKSQHTHMSGYSQATGALESLCKIAFLAAFSKPGFGTIAVANLVPQTSSTGFQKSRFIKKNPG